MSFEKMKDKEEKMSLDTWVMEWSINNVLDLLLFVSKLLSKDGFFKFLLSKYEHGVDMSFVPLKQMICTVALVMGY